MNVRTCLMVFTIVASLCGIVFDKDTLEILIRLSGVAYA